MNGHRRIPDGDKKALKIAITPTTLVQFECQCTIGLGSIGTMVFGTKSGVNTVCVRLIWLVQLYCAVAVMKMARFEYLMFDPFSLFRNGRVAPEQAAKAG